MTMTLKRRRNMEVLCMMQMFVLIAGLQSIVNGLVRFDDERSSFIRQKEKSRLKGHVIGKKNAPSFMTCAQFCLVQTLCKSINYKATGVCELNDATPTEEDIEPDQQYTLGWLLSVQAETFVFTSLGARGQYGPTNTNGYNGSNLEGKVQVVNGIQNWTVPITGNYVIEAYGASGANGTCIHAGCVGWSSGGNGAKITGTLTLRKGTELRLLIGQQGLFNLVTSDSPGGGGGGTFVTFANDTPLIIAGGGGGGGITKHGTQRDGDPGQAGINGTRHGGSHGHGGQRYDTKTKSVPPMTFLGFSSAGAGLLTDGNAYGGSGPASFIKRGTGGNGGSDGGFGGGGFALSYSPGGGGGYSGGGVVLNNGIGTAGGGGSFNAGSNQLNQEGFNKGDGQIVIKLIL